MGLIDEETQSLAKIICHELAHGIIGLRHGARSIEVLETKHGFECRSDPPWSGLAESIAELAAGPVSDRLVAAVEKFHNITRAKTEVAGLSRTMDPGRFWATYSAVLPDPDDESLGDAGWIRTLTAGLPYEARPSCAHLVGEVIDDVAELTDTCSYSGLLSIGRRVKNGGRVVLTSRSDLLRASENGVYENPEPAPAPKQQRWSQQAMDREIARAYEIQGRGQTRH